MFQQIIGEASVIPGNFSGHGDPLNGSTLQSALSEQPGLSLDFYSSGCLLHAKWCSCPAHSDRMEIPHSRPARD
jgi:hypothetical protein